MEFANKEEIQYLQSLTEQTSLNFLLKEKAFKKKLIEDCKYLIAMSTVMAEQTPLSHRYSLK
ncbi:hypothetical protein FACS1894199_19330 [Bacteroidia bacterium]|nr:hypothetical protein FACS1894199_19330 [Bacteroidia bacterium]